MLSGESPLPLLGGRALWLVDEAGDARVMGWAEGGDDAVVHLANARDVAVLGACDGRATLDELAADVGLPVSEVAELLALWRQRMPGSVRDRVDPRLRRLRRVATAMMAEIEGVTKLATRADLVAYHVHGITDAAHQFEDVETTVSHAYSAPCAGLGGLTYGAALFDRCAADGLIPGEGGAKVLEIGCGTGRFARAWLGRFREARPEAYAVSTYTMFDLSPALAASQRQMCREHAERIIQVAGDVETDAIGESFDTILCNEVIADLSVDVVSRDDLGAPTAGATAVRRYGLDLAGAMDRFLVNTGALAALSRIAAALRPGGGALVTEYGSRTGFPQPAVLGGHTEHSIHFGHLEQAARVLGLEARCEPLPAFLGFDVRHEVLSGASMRLLRKVAPRIFGHSLPALAYDRSGLRGALGDAFDRLGNLRWVPLSDDTAYLAPSRFLALSLRKIGP